MLNEMDHGEIMIYPPVVDYRHCIVISNVVLSVEGDVMKVVITHMIISMIKMWI